MPLNEYYVEVPAGPAVGRFLQAEVHRVLPGPGGAPGPARPPGEVILDFMVRDADAEYRRIEALGVDWVLRPATQPWGSRSMIFKDPEGNLVNVFSRP